MDLEKNISIDMVRIPRDNEIRITVLLKIFLLVEDGEDEIREPRYVQIDKLFMSITEFDELYKTYEALEKKLATKYSLRG